MPLTEALSYPVIRNALAACLLCGLSCAVVSIFVVYLRMPLIGVAMSHAAFAGAVGGLLFGTDVFVSSLAMCLVVSAMTGPVSDAAGVHRENVLGIMLSAFMGLAFLGLGMIARSKANALTMLWGDMLSVSRGEITVSAVILAGIVIFVAALGKEIQSVLFHRRLAMLSGVPDKFVLYAILAATGAVVSANMQTVGGMLIFTLIVQPGAAAALIARTLRAAYLFSAVFGLVSCLAGFVFSYYFNTPSGATIALTSTAMFIGVRLWTIAARSNKTHQES